MKNFTVLFFAIFAFVALVNTGCETRVIENHFWECTNCDDEGNCEECIESEHDPRPDSVEKDSDDAVAKDDDTVVNEDDSVAPDYDQDIVAEEEPDSDNAEETDTLENDSDNIVEVDTVETDSDLIINLDDDTIFPDEDVLANYCEPMKDKTGDPMNGTYSDGNAPGDTKTVLTITLISQTEEKNCLVIFSSATISKLNGLSVGATKMPVNQLSLKFPNLAGTVVDCYFFMSFSSSNTLKITVYEQSDWDIAFEQTFIPK